LASAASFTASSYPTTGTATSAAGNDVFTTEGGNVQCNSHFHATLGAASNDLTVEPTYTGCQAFGFLEATVTGCRYTFTAVSTTSANVDVVSPCTVKAGTCHITVHSQGPRSGITLTNNPAGDISVKADLSNLTTTVITDGFLCPFSGTGEKTGATYKQGSAITFDAVNPASAIIAVS
jgi:hypothetical protein